MEKLIVLGTGNASVTKCYNTCSIIQDKKGRYFMIDAGGGNGILTQLEKMNIPVTEIHDIFLTHEHTDHLLGMIWMIRVIGQAIQKGKYEGNCTAEKAHLCFVTDRENKNSFWHRAWRMAFP